MSGLRVGARIKVGTLTCGNNGSVSAPSKVLEIPRNTFVKVFPYSLRTHSLRTGLPPLMVLCSMNTRPHSRESAPASELLIESFVAIQALLMSGELELGKQIFLSCPCGKLILPPIMVQENIKAHQRGLLKAKVERHLREQHGVSRYEIGRVLKDSFAAT